MQRGRGPFLIANRVVVTRAHQKKIFLLLYLALIFFISIHSHSPTFYIPPPRVLHLIFSSLAGPTIAPPPPPTMLPLLHIIAVPPVDAATPLFIAGLGLFFIARAILLISEALTQQNPDATLSTTKETQNDPSSELTDDDDAIDDDDTDDLTPTLFERVRQAKDRVVGWVEEHWLDVLCDQRTYVVVLLSILLMQRYRVTVELPISQQDIIINYTVGLIVAILDWFFNLVVPAVRLSAIRHHRKSISTLSDRYEIVSLWKEFDDGAICGHVMFGLTIGCVAWPIFTVLYVGYHTFAGTMRFIIRKQVEQEKRRERRRQQPTDAKRCKTTSIDTRSLTTSSAPEIES